MTKDEQIADLCARADALRSLPDDEAEEKGLPSLVDAINALRASPDEPTAIVAVEEGADAPDLVVEDQVPDGARKRGRPRKTDK